VEVSATLVGLDALDPAFGLLELPHAARTSAVPMTAAADTKLRMNDSFG
jgi:hypothetical protein